MKAVIKTASILAVTIVGIATTEAQVYQYSPVVDNFGIGLFAGGNLLIGLGTLNCTYSDTVTINASAGTIEQAGTIVIPALGTGSANYQQTQSLGAVFPNPPSMVTGDVALALSCAGGTFQFDTGARGLTFEHGTTWGFNGSTGFTVPITLSYTLTTGGQTYSDTLQTSEQCSIDLGSAIDIANFPASLTLIPFSPQPIGDLTEDSGINITAADGFVLNGLTVSPEPSTLVLFGVGSIVFMRLFKRNRQQITNPCP